MSRRSSHTTKVFVGSLPPNVTAQDLQQLFSPYGAIAECDIANRCGFLHLEDKELAMKAIADLNNTTFMGGKISVEKGRVKPRGDRRMRPPRGGGPGGMGRKPRDMGPYSRDSSNYGRNGSYGPRDYNNYDEFRGDYPPPRDFDNGYNRRPMYEERRGGGYMNDRRPYNNGYERRQYSDDRSQYPPPPRGGGYDRRMAPNGPSSYDDRRAPVNDRRPLIPEQSMGQAQRPPMSYDRAPPSNDMFSRRDSVPKPLTSFSTSAYDRPAQSGYGGYGSPDPAAAYGVSAPTGSYGAPVSSSYSQPPSTGYGDNRGQSTGYMDNRQPPAPIPSGGFGGSQAYSSVPSGGYGDNYGVRAPTNTYDTAYPPLPQQRGFAGGNAPGPHRDMPPARRY